MNPAIPQIPAIPEIARPIITDVLDALSASCDPEVKSWVAQVTKMIPADTTNSFTCDGPHLIARHYGI